VKGGPNLSWDIRDVIMEPSFSSLGRVRAEGNMGKEDGQDRSIVRLGVLWRPVVLGAASRLCCTSEMCASLTEETHHRSKSSRVRPQSSTSNNVKHSSS
jgi:hypothetical protein